MLKDVIRRSFKTRNAAQARHWTTDSYAQHKALGDFYEDLIETLDKFAEAYQGVYGQLKKAPEEPEDIIDTLREDLRWIMDNRSDITNSVPALDNILDEMAAVYMKALYKLENLK